jgi:glucose-6-phosphate 1-dehydrogenase
MSRVTEMIRKLVLFGATGDLVGRYLLPALAGLHATGRLPEGFFVVGASRQEWTDGQFQRYAAQRLEQHATDIPATARDTFVRTLRYRRVDFASMATVADVVQATGEPLAAYLALPPSVFPLAVRALGEVGLPEDSRIVLEKPFGEDLQSAVALNALLERVVGAAGERAVFRVDHALGLAAVRNLIEARRTSAALEQVWNSAHIERVDILWDETLALEGRASFYDNTGALKDVVQNHVMQILCAIAMELPSDAQEQDLSTGRLSVLRSIRSLTEADVVSITRRASYTAGSIGGRYVPGYVENEGIDPARCTETFAEVVLEIDNPRWAGTRFLLRTGKALARSRQEAVVKFRRGAALPFGADAELADNELRIGLDGPGSLNLRRVGMTRTPESHVVQIVADASFSGPEAPAYGRVLLDILNGSSTLSVGADEAEAAWRVLTPVLEGWAEDRVPLQEYAAGSEGPPPS